MLKSLKTSYATGGKHWTSFKTRVNEKKLFNTSSDTNVICTTKFVENEKIQIFMIIAVFYIKTENNHSTIKCWKKSAKAERKFFKYQIWNVVNYAVSSLPWPRFQASAPRRSEAG